MSREAWPYAFDDRNPGIGDLAKDQIADFLWDVLALLQVAEVGDALPLLAHARAPIIKEVLQIDAREILAPVGLETSLYPASPCRQAPDPTSSIRFFAPTARLAHGLRLDRQWVRVLGGQEFIDRFLLTLGSLAERLVEVVGNFLDSRDLAERAVAGAPVGVLVFDPAERVEMIATALVDLVRAPCRPAADTSG